MGAKGFFQGEKKKKKKGEVKQITTGGPVFTQPSVQPKGKNKY